MSSQSTLNDDEKARVKSAVQDKIYFAALARIYYAHPQPGEWSYTGLQGALVFSLDKSTNTRHFKMVDLDGKRGVTWDHELYHGLEFNQDRNFFHSFAGDNCMIGFVYANEQEAQTFYKKVLNKDRKSPKAKSNKKKNASEGGKIDKSMISPPQPGSFVHVAHMGYDSGSGFTSKGVDPSWTAFLADLEGTGVSKDVIAREMDYIKTFVRQYPEQQRSAGFKEANKPGPLPAPRHRHTCNGSSSLNQSLASPASHAPFPPPAQSSQAPSPTSQTHATPSRAPPAPPSPLPYPLTPCTDAHANFPPPPPYYSAGH